LCFILEVHDPPLESTFFPHGILSQEVTQCSTPIGVLVTGAHQYSGQLGVLCEPVEFNDSSIKSYMVKLEPDHRMVTVDVSYLIPWSVNCVTNGYN
jgi:hypothetical protein